MREVQLDVGALYAALDAQRRSRGHSWRQLAYEAGVSPSTLTRMAQGRRPDVDSFGGLVRWLSLPAEQFLRGSIEGPEAEEPADTMAVVSGLLRSSKELSPEGAAAMEDIMQAAFRRLKKLK